LVNAVAVFFHPSRWPVRDGAIPLFSAILVNSAPSLLGIVQLENHGDCCCSSMLSQQLLHLLNLSENVCLDLNNWFVELLSRSMGMDLFTFPLFPDRRSRSPLERLIAPSLLPEPGSESAAGLSPHHKPSPMGEHRDW
jgi:hypothetical protein